MKEIRLEVEKIKDYDFVGRIVNLLSITTGKSLENIDVYEDQGIIVLNLTGNEPEYIIKKAKESLHKTFGKQIIIK